MVDKKLTKLLIDNKENLLEYHKNFYEVIDKIKSYEDLTKDLILSSEKFVDEDGKFNKQEFINFLITRLLTSRLNGFGDLFPDFN